MKRIMGLLAGFALAASAMAQNLVVNGGFEDMEGWNAADPNGRSWMLANDDGVSKASSMRIIMDPHHKASDMVQRIACKPNTTYTLSAALKGERALPKVSVRTMDGIVLTEFKARDIDALKWKRHAKEFTTEADCRELEVVLSLEVIAKDGAVMAAVDDVSVTEGELAEADKAAVSFAPPEGTVNLALHKPYTMTPAPNYGHCTDPDDAIQLTDGIFTDGYFWTQKTTVGWTNINVISVTVDLGRVEPIGGFMVSMAGGYAGVTFPDLIYIYTSEDNVSWRRIGDLVAKSMEENREPLHDEYNTFRYGTVNMPAKGRYVTLLFSGRAYTFMDEIEIYRGDETLLAREDLGSPVRDPMNHFSNQQLAARLNQDIRTLEKAAKTCAAPVVETLAEAIADIRKKLDMMDFGNMDDMLTIIPICDLQREIFALNAKVLRDKGFRKPMLWGSCRWDNLQPMDAPASAEPPSFVCEMMRNEVRAESFNILNPTDLSITYDIRVTGFPDGAGTDIREVLFTDTKQLKCVSSALRPGDGDRIRVEVPAGTSRQIWLSFKRPTLKAGTYVGKATLTPTDNSQETLSLDLRLIIDNVDFPAEPRLHLGGWDYVENGAKYYRAPGNLAANLAIMRDIYVDSPWANPVIQPTGAKFDEAGHLVNADELDYGVWDAWVALWKGARLYCVFMAVKDNFHGELMGTDRFNTMVGEYYKAFIDHAATQGIRESQFLFLIYDEPYSKEADNIIVTWAKAMKLTVPQVNLYIDPLHDNPADALPGLYESMDVICPNMVYIMDKGKPYKDFFMKLKEKGKKLALYACSGPARLLDPVKYHRAQMWRAFEFDAFFCGYWAFGCGGGIGDSWHAYKQRGNEYSPYFVSPTDTMDAKQSAGVQEGVQDYEILCMLKEKIAAAKAEGKDTAAAERLLNGAVERALAVPPNSKNGGSIMWDTDGDRSQMDKVRIEITRMLATM